MHNIRVHKIAKMGGEFSYINCECTGAMKKCKNIFNKNAPICITNGSVEITKLDTGIKAKLTGYTYYTYGGIIISDIEDVKGKTLTLSAKINASGYNNTSIKLYGVSNNYEPIQNFVSLNETGSVTINIPETFEPGVKKLEILFYANVNSAEAEIGDYVEYTDVQLERGSIATDYEPYIGW